MFKIYQIELTNHCNAKCRYCPHGLMTRKKGFIHLVNLEKILKYMKSIGQKYVALHHMGEPLLYPDIKEAINMCHKYNIKCEFSTNGQLILIRKRHN